MRTQRLSYVNWFKVIGYGCEPWQPSSQGPYSWISYYFFLEEILTFKYFCTEIWAWRLKFTLLLLMLSHFSCVRLCATPWTAAYQAPPSLGFSRQKHWSGLPFPSPKFTLVICIWADFHWHRLGGHWKVSRQGLNALPQKCCQELPVQGECWMRWPQGPHPSPSCW